VPDGRAGLFTLNQNCRLLCKATLQAASSPLETPPKRSPSTKRRTLQNHEAHALQIADDPLSRAGQRTRAFRWRLFGLGAKPLDNLSVQERPALVFERSERQWNARIFYLYLKCPRPSL
jgi:hypothetical protein